MTLGFGIGRVSGMSGMMVMEGKGSGGEWMADVYLADLDRNDGFGGRVVVVDCRLTARVACSALTKLAGVTCAVSTACLGRA